MSRPAIAEMIPLLTSRGRGIPGRLHTGHLVERVGLFAIIVLGESVPALITSTDHVRTAAAGMVAVLGFGLPAALRWSYFDFAPTAAERVIGTADRRDAHLLARDVAGFLYPEWTSSDSRGTNGPTSRPPPSTPGAPRQGHEGRPQPAVALQQRPDGRAAGAR
ncbi:hypothetical protein GCM10010230_24970 [Streptomyces narbonensis]|uniref:low temperature requirement protein A n=1 Tax=Streptomyces narbonensis TaxID=67333 RepID=UPI001673434D|nr:low temperature requirement protein A [Streptomyces narbonensis]GGV99265.1 hypothetical protein GCM10010230_24970 [Streptomyces narbonensis]